MTMINKKQCLLWSLIGQLLAVSLVLAQTTAPPPPNTVLPPPNFSYQTNPNDVYSVISYQRDRQITRQISDNISRRITSEVDENLRKSAMKSASLTVNRLAASSDLPGWMPDTVWNTFSWSRLSNDGNYLGNVEFDTDIFENTMGFDKKWNDFLFGAAITYAYSNTNDINFGFGHFDAQNHSITVTPFIAYVINKYFFVSGLSSYGYARDNANSTFGTGKESDQDNYVSELNLNGFRVFDSWYIKGKIGARYQHSYTKGRADVGSILSSADADNWTYLADSEFGYSITKDLRAYSGILYEYQNPKPNLGQPDSVFYYNMGVDYVLSKVFTMGLKAQTDLSNEYVDLTTVALNMRLNLD